MKAIVYTRQSLDRSGEGAAVDRQLQDSRELAQLRGWEIVAEYQDNDISAAGDKQRPGFEASLSAIKNGYANALIAWNLDRLTRNRRDTVRLIEISQEANALIAVVRGSDLDMSTPAGRMTADLLAAVARNEIEVKSDRHRRSNEQAAHAGKPPRGGRRAFGYTLDGLTVVENEAAAIRDGYTKLLAGASLSAIAKTWNSAGFPTTAGGVWNGPNVRLVLKNPRYAALRRYRGEIVGPGKWPAIIDEETYQAALAVFADPTRNKVTDRSIKWLLTQIAKCGRCGGPMATAHTQHKQRTYKCVQYSELSVRADRIDHYVVELVVARLSQPDVADLLTPSPHVDLPGLRHQANVLRARMEEAAQLFAEGTITGAQLSRINADVSARLGDTTKKLADAGSQDVLARFVDAEDVRGVWKNLHVLTQREIVKTLFESITLLSPGKGNRKFDPKNVVVEWKR